MLTPINIRPKARMADRSNGISTLKGRGMSALGQKQTFAVNKSMSALCQKRVEEMSGCAATAGERVALRSVWVLQRSRHSTDWDCKTHDCPPAHSADIVLLSYIDSPNRHYLRQS